MVLRPEKPNLRPERPVLRPERLDLRLERPNLRPERLDLRPERPYLRSQRPNLRPEGPDGGDERTNKRTDGRTNESPPVFYRTSSPSGPLPKKEIRKTVICIYSNQSPKGNMWSAIPFALLCMIVYLSERKQGSGPEGDEVL